VSPLLQQQRQQVRRKQARGWHQRFLGSRARLNCENIPVIPARLVQDCLADPRRIPYLLVWKNARDGKIEEAVRVARYIDDCDPRAAINFLEIKRMDGDASVLRMNWQSLPNGGRALLLICSYCATPRRHVYGWEWDALSGWSNRVRRISWRCRSCARLRYSSEGGYLSPSYAGLGRLGQMLRGSWGNLPRPELWFPYVFSSLEAAQDWLAEVRREE
jgi:hypothetical protein